MKMEGICLKKVLSRNFERHLRGGGVEKNTFISKGQSTIVYGIVDIDLFGNIEEF